MQRLLDHFRYSQDVIPADGLAEPGPREDRARIGLRQGRFSGLPVWFHPLGETTSRTLLLTDDRQPFDPDDAIASIQLERYVGDSSGSLDTEKGLRSLYYLLKPLLPRGLQLELQRLNARRRLQKVQFPRWPHDSTLTLLLQAFLAELMRAAGQESIPFLGFWPHGKTWAWSLTHDVDTALGYKHLDSLSRIEEQRALRSAWYFVPARYRWEATVLDGLRAHGHEIGVHGYDHSGKLFANRSEFEWRRDKINEYLQEWRASGFRSPATYRHPVWLTEIQATYDSSYLDVATLEPQRGGVCAPFPFMLSEDLVEIPITLPMDHTLINILRTDPCDGCCAKAEWIREQHGLAVALFHPDYNVQSQRSERYAALLDELLQDQQAWSALPNEIADWWQRRRRSSVRRREGRVEIEGPAAADGRVWWAHREGTQIRIEPALD